MAPPLHPCHSGMLTTVMSDDANDNQAVVDANQGFQREMQGSSREQAFSTNDGNTSLSHLSSVTADHADLLSKVESAVEFPTVVCNDTTSSHAVTELQSLRLSQSRENDQTSSASSTIPVAVPLAEATTITPAVISLEISSCALPVSSSPKPAQGPDLDPLIQWFTDQSQCAMYNFKHSEMPVELFRLICHVMSQHTTQKETITMLRRIFPSVPTQKVAAGSFIVRRQLLESALQKLHSELKTEASAPPVSFQQFLTSNSVNRLGLREIPENVLPFLVSLLGKNDDPTEVHRYLAANVTDYISFMQLAQTRELCHAVLCVLVKQDARVIGNEVYGSFLATLLASDKRSSKATEAEVPISVTELETPIHRPLPSSSLKKPRGIQIKQEETEKEKEEEEASIAEALRLRRRRKLSFDGLPTSTFSKNAKPSSSSESPHDKLTSHITPFKHRPQQIDNAARRVASRKRGNARNRQAKVPDPSTSDDEECSDLESDSDISTQPSDQKHVPSSATRQTFRTKRRATTAAAIDPKASEEASEWVYTIPSSYFIKEFEPEIPASVFFIVKKVIDNTASFAEATIALMDIFPKGLIKRLEDLQKAVRKCIQLNKMPLQPVSALLSQASGRLQEDAMKLATLRLNRYQKPRLEERPTKPITRKPESDRSRNQGAQDTKDQPSVNSSRSIIQVQPSVRPSRFMTVNASHWRAVATWMSSAQYLAIVQRSIVIPDMVFRAICVIIAEKKESTRELNSFFHCSLQAATKKAVNKSIVTGIHTMIREKLYSDAVQAAFSNIAPTKTDLASVISYLAACYSPDSSLQDKSNIPGQVVNVMAYLLAEHNERVSSIVDTLSTISPQRRVNLEHLNRVLIEVRCVLAQRWLNASQDHADLPADPTSLSARTIKTEEEAFSGLQTNTSCGHVPDQHGSGQNTASAKDCEVFGAAPLGQPVPMPTGQSLQQQSRLPRFQTSIPKKKLPDVDFLKKIRLNPSQSVETTSDCDVKDDDDDDAASIDLINVNRPFNSKLSVTHVTTPSARRNANIWLQSCDDKAFRNDDFYIPDWLCAIGSKIQAELVHQHLVVEKLFEYFDNLQGSNVRRKILGFQASFLRQLLKNALQQIGEVHLTPSHFTALSQFVRQFDDSRDNKHLNISIRAYKTIIHLLEQYSDQSGGVYEALRDQTDQQLNANSVHSICNLVRAYLAHQFVEEFSASNDGSIFPVCIPRNGTARPEATAPVSTNSNSATCPVSRANRSMDAQDARNFLSLVRDGPIDELERMISLSSVESSLPSKTHMSCNQYGIPVKPSLSCAGPPLWTFPTRNAFILPPTCPMYAAGFYFGPIPDVVRFTLDHQGQTTPTLRSGNEPEYSSPTVATSATPNASILSFSNQELAASFM